MISVKPQYCADIMNGDKTIEIRKNKGLANAIQKLIDTNGYAEIYVYCTKDGELFYDPITKKWLSFKSRNIKRVHRLSNGVVKFKFRCYNVEEIKVNLAMRLFTESTNEKELLEKSCLNSEQLNNYLDTIWWNGKTHICGYDIHISELEIFDRPKELSEFKIPCDFKCPELGCCYCHKNTRLSKAPQNMVYIEV